MKIDRCRVWGMCTRAELFIESRSRRGERTEHPFNLKLVAFSLLLIVLGVRSIHSLSESLLEFVLKSGICGFSQQRWLGLVGIPF